MSSILSILFSIVGCGQQSDVPQSQGEEITDVEDIPTPSDDLDNEDGTADNTDPTEDNPGPVTLSYTFGDSDSLLYVQVYKDEDAWGSGFAHNHVMRASNWYGYIDYNTSDISVCDFEFALPVADLMVDEDAMRQYVGYGDTISQSDRNTIREHMLASDQLNANSHQEISFYSTNCELKNDTTLRITGDMSIAGNTRSISFDVDFNAQAEKFYVSGMIETTHAQFGLQPYEAFGGTVRNDEPLDISFDMVGFAN